MKIRFIALAAAALVAGQAYAASPAALNQYTFYVSGSSALTPVIKAIFGTNAVGGAAGVSEWKNTATSANQFIYQATVLQSSVLGQKLGLTGNTLVTVFKRDSGGSIYGVNPLVSGAGNTPVNVGFLSETSTFDGNNIATTAVTKNAIPHLGAADTEPSILQTQSNLARNPDGTPVFAPLTQAKLNALTSKTVLLQTFGVAVNNRLVTKLQSVQGLSGTNAPSLSVGQVQSLVNTGALTTASKSWGYIFGDDDLAQINIARRAAGSGTQATANILFSNAAAGTSADTPLAAADSDAPLGNTGILFVSEAGSTSGVTTVLNNADGATLDAATYAIGYVGYENKPATGDTWKFIKLNGYTPDIANAQVGNYPWAFENTFNYNTAYYNNPANVRVKGFIDGILQEAQSATTYNALSANLKSAVIPVSLSTATRGGNSNGLLKITK